jgi:hypothetical protein
MPDWTKLTGNLFDIAFTMARRGTTVDLVRRKGTPPPAAQPVIVATPGTQASEARGAAGNSGRWPVVLIGYRAYTGKTDFDVIQGDTFNLGPNEHRVIFVDDTIPGRREASCEATSR